MIKLLSTSSFSFPKDPSRVNEDAVLAPVRIGTGYLFAVADGVGSYEGASLASEAAIKELALMKSDPTHHISELFNAIRERVINLVKLNKAYSKAATTLTLCYIDEHGVNIGHIGDCRLYCIDAKKSYQLTKDHTQHQMLIDNKLFKPKDLKDKPGKNILTTAIASNVEMLYENYMIPWDDLSGMDGIYHLCIMSDGAHHAWEHRPRFTPSTMASTQKFANGLLRRIERFVPSDDYSLVSISIQREHFSSEPALENK